MAQVVQLTAEQLGKLEAVDQGDGQRLGWGTPVVFLEDSTDADAGVTFSAGRRGWSRRAVNNNGVTRFDNLEYTKARSVPSVAVMNTRVEVGDTVIAVAGANAGREGVVRQVIDDQWLTVASEPQQYWHDRVFFKCGAWVKVVRSESVPLAGTAAVAMEEDLTISDWWITRIKRIAREAKNKHGFCSQIDSVLKELLAPLAPHWTVKEEDGGWGVYSPTGVKTEWHLEKSAADKSAEKRTSKEVV